MTTSDARTFAPQLIGKVDPQLYRALSQIYEAIYQLQDKTEQQVTQVLKTQQQQQQQLIDILANPVLGFTATTDPQLVGLPTQPGTGTVVSITVTGDPTNGLNVGGSPITTSGTITITFGASINVATSYKVATTQVVSSRKTGWTAWTGTADRTSHDTSTATLANVAQALKALLDDLISHGLIGT